MNMPSLIHALLLAVIPGLLLQSAKDNPNSRGEGENKIGKNGLDRPWRIFFDENFDRSATR